MNSISNTQINIPASMPQFPANPAGNTEQTDGNAFKNFLLDSIGDVNSMQQEADKAVENLMTGDDANPAEVLTAVQKADLTFRLMMQMRNKMMQVYQEVQDIRV